MINSDVAPQDEGRGRKVLTMFEKGLLAGKRILVTGGGSGLGAAMGRRFVELGAELIICGRRLELLQATAAELRDDPRGKGRASPCDCHFVRPMPGWRRRCTARCIAHSVRASAGSKADTRAWC